MFNRYVGPSSKLSLEFASSLDCMALNGDTDADMFFFLLGKGQ